MINNSKQHWTLGNIVKVGFLSLRIVGFEATPGDWLPDAYIMENTAGTKKYRFVPHNGLTAI